MLRLVENKLFIEINTINFFTKLDPKQSFTDISVGPTVFRYTFCQIPRLTAANSWNRPFYSTLFRLWTSYIYL